MGTEKQEEQKTDHEMDDYEKEVLETLREIKKRLPEKEQESHGTDGTSNTGTDGKQLTGADIDSAIESIEDKKEENTAKKARDSRRKKRHSGK